MVLGLGSLGIKRRSEAEDRLLSLLHAFSPPGDSSLWLSFALLLRFSVLAVGIGVVLRAISANAVFIAFVVVTVSRNMCLSNISTHGISSVESML